MTLNYPRPNVPGALTQNFVTATKIGGINAQYNIRLDHRLSDKNNLFARYTYWKADSNPYDSWGTQTQGQGHTGLYTHEAVVGDTHAFNSSTILDVRLAYLRVFQHEYPDSSGVDLSQFGPGWAALTKSAPGAGELAIHELLRRWSEHKCRQRYWLAAFLDPERIHALGKSHEDLWVAIRSSLVARAAMLRCCKLQVMAYSGSTSQSGHLKCGGRREFTGIGTARNSSRHATRTWTPRRIASVLQLLRLLCG